LVHLGVYESRGFFLYRNRGLISLGLFATALTLAPTVATLSKTLPPHHLASLASAVPFVPEYFLSSSTRTSGHSPSDDAAALSAAIDKLVDDLGLKTNLTAYSVPKADLAGIAQKAASLFQSKNGYPTADQIHHEILEKIY
jgi:alcohol dehydrogenase class IV